jgi:hypothetical protein
MLGISSDMLPKHLNRSLALQVAPDASSASGYTVHLSQLRNQPSWQWDYTMHEDNTITLKLVEGEDAPSAAIPVASGSDRTGEALDATVATRIVRV